MRHAIGPLLGAGLVVGIAGGMHGVQSNRWHTSARLESALSRTAFVPSAVGDWKGEDVPYETDDMARAGIQGCVYRVYRNVRARQSVSVLLVCGRGGPISVHTPDVCYAGAGYRQMTDAKPRGVELGSGRKETFQVARFVKAGVVPTQLEIYWGWSRDGRSWEAPENPRWSYARLPALYKLYVVRQFVAGTREEAADSCQDFLRRAIPEFGQSLAPGE